jgi:sec-independent protein translocase protein TatA
MFEDLGFWKLILIFLLIVILFGSKKIPDFAQGLGKGIREFKKAMRGDEEETKSPQNPEKKPEDKQIE